MSLLNIRAQLLGREGTLHVRLLLPTTAIAADRLLDCRHVRLEEVQDGSCFDLGLLVNTAQPEAAPLWQVICRGPNGAVSGNPRGFSIAILNRQLRLYPNKERRSSRRETTPWAISPKVAGSNHAGHQIKEISRSVGYTARPAPGEAASPWQAIYTVQPDNLMGPPSRGGRRMDDTCLNGRKPRALTGGRLPRQPTYNPILQRCKSCV